MIMLKKLVLTGLSALPLAFGLEAQDVSVSGHYMGMLNRIDRSSHTQSQFDFAGNLDFNFTLSEKVTGIIQLQGGNGGGPLGLVGADMAVTDINVVYNDPEQDLVLTMGSFDTPFGQQTNYLTNNADSTGSKFLLNSLLYSAFAGPMGTLNTLGVKGDKTWGALTLTGVVSNGTGETATNRNSAFESLLQTTVELGGLTLSATYMHSDDSGDAAVTENTSFATEFSGVIADARYTFRDQHVASYAGILTYGDDNGATDDNVTVWMIEYGAKFGHYTLGTRLSGWMPENYSSNSTNTLVAPEMSPDVKQPGLSDTAPNDTNVTRYQLTGGYELDENVMLKVEFLHDNYSQGDDANAILVAINGAF